MSPKGKVDMIESVTYGLNPEERPKVYFASRGAGAGFYDPKEGRDFTRTEPKYDPLTMVGGINIASEINGSTINVA